MTGEEGTPGPQPDPVPQPQPVPAQPPQDNPANVLGGVFLIGCGLCLLLVGGGCTGLLIYAIIASHSSGGLSMLVISLAMAATGIFAIVQGIRMTRGRRGG